MSSLQKKAPHLVAIVPSKGIGDAIIFLQAAQAFYEQGQKVIFFHSACKTLLPLTPFSFGNPADLEKQLFIFDHVIVQYDDSIETKKLLNLKNQHKAFYVFYPTYKKEKHGSLAPHDFVFDATISMVENVKKSLKKAFSFPSFTLPKLDLEQTKKKQKQVLIHPFSQDKKKNWPLQKYCHLARKLQKKGYSPLFLMSDKEKQESFTNEPFSVANTPTLSDLAQLMQESSFFIGNDSGPGHLASLIQLPSLILADEYKRLKLWRPGYSPCKVLCCPNWVINFKGFRLKKDYWHTFIPVAKVLSSFFSLKEC